MVSAVSSGFIVSPFVVQVCVNPGWESVEVCGWLYLKIF